MRKPPKREYFESVYEQSADPYDYETSSFNHRKYERTIEVLEHRRYSRVLEAGCSIGTFTAMLAPLSDEVLATDISEKAVIAARERLADFPHVRIQQRTLPEETPKGPFDLIVASDILYYMPRDVILATLQRFEEVLAPGGALLAFHGRWYTWRHQAVKLIEKAIPHSSRLWPLKHRTLHGDEVHELLAGHTRLVNTVRLVEPRYLLDLFEDR